MATDLFRTKVLVRPNFLRCCDPNFVKGVFFGGGKRGKNTRTRKITWFNPPFSMNVATNIGKNFFSLLNECFPKTSKLHKIINKNTIKLSYSCMANMKQKIDNHNRKIMSNWREREEFTRTCNCRDKTLYPLKGKCLQE